MGLRIIGANTLESNLNKNISEYENSLEKLTSGAKFTKSNPQIVEQIQSQKLQSKMRELNAYKKNINDGLSLTQTADSSLQDISNSVVRMREIVSQSMNSNLSDKERQFLFVEYQGHYDEINRVASSTQFQDYSLLDQSSENGLYKSNLPSFKIGSSTYSDNKDLSVVSLEDIKDVSAKSENLGLISADSLVHMSEGVSLEDVTDLFESSDSYSMGESFEKASNQISEYRAQYGAVTSRLYSAFNHTQVAYENISAANSKLRDVDYATELTNMTRANILVQASSSLISSNNQSNMKMILNLIKNNDF